MAKRRGVCPFAAEFTLALDLLQGMVQQHCYEKDNDYDSRFLTADARAMRFLGKHGRMEIADGGGRVVSGRFKRTGAG